MQSPDADGNVRQEQAQQRDSGQRASVHHRHEKNQTQYTIENGRPDHRKKYEQPKYQYSDLAALPVKVMYFDKHVLTVSVNVMAPR